MMNHECTSSFCDGELVPPIEQALLTGPPILGGLAGSVKQMGHDTEEPSP